MSAASPIQPSVPPPEPIVVHHGKISIQKTTYHKIGFFEFLKILFTGEKGALKQRLLNPKPKYEYIPLIDTLAAQANLKTPQGPPTSPSQLVAERILNMSAEDSANMSGEVYHVAAEDLLVTAPDAQHKPEIYNLAIQLFQKASACFAQSNEPIKASVMAALAEEPLTDEEANKAIASLQDEAKGRMNEPANANRTLEELVLEAAEEHALKLFTAEKPSMKDLWREMEILNRCSLNAPQPVTLGKIQEKLLLHTAQFHKSSNASEFLEMIAVLSSFNRIVKSVDVSAAIYHLSYSAAQNIKDSDDLWTLASYLYDYSRVLNQPDLLTTAHKLFDKAAEIDPNPAAARMRIAQIIQFGVSHPLHNMEAVIKEGATKQTYAPLGVHFSGCDTGMLKGGHLNAVQREAVPAATGILQIIANRGIKAEQPAHIRFDFKLSHFARQDVDKSIKALKSADSAKNPQLKGVTISSADDTFEGNNGVSFTPTRTDISTSPPDIPPALVGLAPVIVALAPVVATFYFVRNRILNFKAQTTTIKFPDIGEVIIGDTPSIITRYNNVQVKIPPNLPPGEGLQRVHHMLSALGLGSLLCPQRQVDDERLKIAHLFRTYYPKEAYAMERQKEFYEWPLEVLKSKIVATCPDMQKRFDKYLKDFPELMQLVEIAPGQKAWAITDLHTQLKQEGAWGLMAGTSGSSETMALILRDGPLSTETRFNAGAIVQGASAIRDINAGSGNQVFTRCVGNNLKDFTPYSFNLSGNFQVLYDLEAINRGGYAYQADEYGTKDPSTYGNRGNLIDFAKNLSTKSNNEVMLKSKIPPEMIRRILVPNRAAYDQHVKHLREKGLVVKNAEGKEVMKLKGPMDGTPVEKFILITNDDTLHQSYIEEWRKQMLITTFNLGDLKKLVSKTWNDACIELGRQWRHLDNKGLNEKLSALKKSFADKGLLVNDIITFRRPFSPDMWSK